MTETIAVINHARARAIVAVTIDVI